MQEETEEASAWKEHWPTSSREWSWQGEEESNWWMAGDVDSHGSPSWDGSSSSSSWTWSNWWSTQHDASALPTGGYASSSWSYMDSST